MVHACVIALTSFTSSTAELTELRVRDDDVLTELRFLRTQFEGEDRLYAERHQSEGSV